MSEASGETVRGAPAGPADGLTDVAGLRVGHAQREGDGWLTGVTVVLAPSGGAVAAVDVRGGGPGTRETDALAPENLVERVDAVMLGGGSAFGLDAASGVVAWLEEQRRGFRVGPEPWQVVPVVPAAVLFDLGRGGDWRARPDAAMGRAAAEAAAAQPPGAPVEQGVAGAGTGAVAGGLKGGVGTASLVLPAGITVAALAVVNAVGSAVDPDTGALYGRAGQPGAVPDPAVHAAARRRAAEAARETARRAASGPREPLNTTLAVIGTDAALTPAQAQKLAGAGHDGLARAIRPAHLMTDGDTVFALATGGQELPQAPDGGGMAGALAFNEVLAAGADALERAVVKAMLAATTRETSGGVFLSYRDLYGDPHA